MIKKLAIAVALVVALIVGLRWTGAGSYTSTALAKFQQKMKGSVPLEFEIERLRHEVAQLMPDMHKNLGLVAEEMVAVDNLKREIAVTRDNLRRQKENILTMTQDLESGSTTIFYGGKPYSAERVKEKLARDYASYQTAEKELASKEKLLEAKERALETAREQLAAMKAQKTKLELQVAQLETELKQLRLAQSRSDFHFDDSQLSRCKSTLEEIRTRLNVEKKKLELEGRFATDNIPVDQKAKPTGELLKEIKSHFGEGSALSAEKN